MKKISQSFSVTFNYDVLFTENIFSPENPTLINLLNKAHNKSLTKVAVVLDHGVLAHHTDLPNHILAYFAHHEQIEYRGNPLVIPGGEAAKNSIDNFTLILEKINEEQIDRHSFLIAIGGGAILDLAGFVAAIGHRGIRHIRIPTTVLAQNDSGVGVKNGINYFGKKNFVGSFVPPFAVINDATFLTTLSDKDWKAGIPEAIKVALIKDKTFFDWLRTNVEALNNRDLPVMKQLVYRCAEMHLEHISTSGDPFERGSSRPLDFGHWAAHKLEQLSRFSLRHGEAVAIGIALDTTYSYLGGFLSEKDWKEVIVLLKNLHLPVYHSLLLGNPGETNKDILDGLEEFREHLGGILTIMLLNKLGSGFEVNEMQPGLIEKAVRILKEESQK